MGIKDLSRILKKKYGYLFQEFDIEILSGKTVAIDAHLQVHRFMATSIKNVSEKTDLMENDPDKEEIMKVYLSKIVNYAKSFTNNNVIPYFIFDGKAPDKKKKTRDEREKEKNRKIDIIRRVRSMNIPSKENLKELETQCSNLYIKSKDDIERTIKALEAVEKVVIVRAEAEGEHTCSELVKSGECYASITRDSDIYAHGCPRNIIECKNNKIKCITYNNILTALELSHKQFVDLCIMLGTDYNDRLYNCGWTVCYPLIKEYGCIEGIIYSWKELDNKISVHKKRYDREIDECWIYVYDRVRYLFGYKLS